MEAVSYMHAVAAYQTVPIFGGVSHFYVLFIFPNQTNQPTIKNAEALHGIVKNLYRPGQISQSSDYFWGKASTIIPEVGSLLEHRTISPRVASHLELDDQAEFNPP
jgi:hypothetical protein